MTSLRPTSPSATSNALDFSGRLLLASLFLPAGLSKITGFSGTVGYIQSAGLPFPELAALGAIAVEILGGLLLIAGLRVRPAALGLAGFTLLASVLFHAYWSAPEAQAFVTQLLFFKNIAVIGGLLALASRPAGAWSLDAKMSSSRAEPPALASSSPR